MGDQWYWNDDASVDYDYVIRGLRDDLETYRFHEAAPNSIGFNVGETEMIKVAEDGFYVRGERVPADANEAKVVYEAFKSFLAWAELNRK